MAASAVGAPPAVGAGMVAPPLPGPARQVAGGAGVVWPFAHGAKPVQDFTNFSTYPTEAWLNALCGVTVEEAERLAVCALLAVNCRNPSEMTWKEVVGVTLWATADPQNLPDADASFKVLTDCKRVFGQEKMRTQATGPHYLAFPGAATFQASHGQAFTAAFGPGAFFLNYPINVF